jgi:hypothetical protein
MKRKVSLLLFCAVVALCAAAPSSFGQEEANVKKPRLRGYFTVKAAPVELASPTVSAGMLPLWSATVESSRDHNAYSYVMVGHNPFSASGSQANAKTQIVPLIIVTHKIGTSVSSTGRISTQRGDTTFDPTVADASCLTAPNDVPLTLVQQSPIIKQTDFNMGGTNVGTAQYIDAFQRANFWQVINQSRYHVRLNPVKTLDPLLVIVPAAKGLALATTSLGPPPFCAPMGIIDINWFDGYLTSTILPALAGQGVNPGTFPIFLLHNVVMASPVTNLNTCCILGYHGTNGFPIQTYSPSNFDSTGLFGPTIEDSAIMSHEVGEWVNDPFGNNPTPPWGHIGQQPGCQNNLEVGDPLTGNVVPPVTMPNGFTYHLQELAFFSWFYGAPSIAVNNWFSDNNTFTTDAGPPCH